VVPETKSVKNRVHLDIYFDTDDHDAEVRRLIDLGANHLWDGKQGPVHLDNSRRPGRQRILRLMSGPGKLAQARAVRWDDPRACG